MVYRLKLLKDLPTLKAGTEIEAISGRDERHSINGLVFYYQDYPYEDIFRLSDDPEWVKKVVAIDRAINTQCAICGSTKGFIYTEPEEDVYDDGVIYSYISIGIECVCGNRTKLRKVRTNSKVVHW